MYIVPIIIMGFYVYFSKNIKIINICSYFLYSQ